MPGPGLWAPLPRKITSSQGQNFPQKLRVNQVFDGEKSCRSRRRAGLEMTDGSPATSNICDMSGSWETPFECLLSTAFSTSRCDCLQIWSPAGLCHFGFDQVKTCLEGLPCQPILFTWLIFLPYKFTSLCM